MISPGSRNDGIGGRESVARGPRDFHHGPLVHPEAVTALVESPYRFEFFQAVRLLKLAGYGAPPGRFTHPANECVRFAAHQSLAFPASEIQTLTRREQGPPLMRVNFMGLTGPIGALPTAYTAQVLERLRDRDSTMRDFFDLFNHRIISLFYRAWEKYRFTVAYEAGEREGLSRHFLDLLGLGTPGLQDRQAVRDDTMIFYSGLLAQRPRSATALRQILRDYFGVPVRIEQFVGVWYALARAEQCEMDGPPRLATQLGFGAVVGDAVWYQQARARIELGPLDRGQYLDFLPGGSAHEPLRAFTRFFGALEMEFEVKLILKREETPACELGGEGSGAPRLGWMTWINTAGMNRDPGDTVFVL